MILDQEKPQGLMWGCPLVGSLHSQQGGDRGTHMPGFVTVCLFFLCVLPQFPHWELERSGGGMRTEQLDSC